MPDDLLGLAFMASSGAGASTDRGKFTALSVCGGVQMVIGSPATVQLG